MIVRVGSAGQISGREYRPDTHLSQTLGSNDLNCIKIAPTERRVIQFYHKYRGHHVAAFPATIIMMSLWPSGLRYCYWADALSYHQGPAC